MAKFEKGKSGNPKGRPKKGRSLTEYLEKALKQERQGGERNKEALAEILIELAIKERNIAAIRYIYDRIDGKPKETVELANGAVDIRLREIMTGGN